MKNKEEIKEIMKYAINTCLNKYNLNDKKYLNIFTDIAYKSLKKYSYDPISRLNEELFIKQNIINDIDKWMVNKAKNDNEFYKIIESYLMKTLDLTCRIRKEKFENITDLDYYKEYAVLKAVETYDENIMKSINLYANDWFLAFVNKEVNEESKSLVLK